MSEQESERITELPKWADNDYLDVLSAFRDYLDKRIQEIEEGLENGHGLDTGDAYLMGYSRGMLSGLRMAYDLSLSYDFMVRWEVYHPDRRDFRWCRDLGP